MEVAALSRPKPGEDANGDAYLVEKCYDNDSPDTEEKVLIAVVDGVGHGKNAEIASRTTIDFIKSHKHKYLSLKDMVKSLHNALLGTRGAVIGICELSSGELSYVGIGNISAQIVSQKEQYHLTSMNGVLGWNLRKVNEFKYNFSSGLLVMNSDGIGRFTASEYISDDLPAMASKIMNQRGKDNDDATIVIVRR
jgi:hypothetical protein